MHEGPLDMRMDTTQGITAEAWLASVDETSLKEVLSTYGEERFSGRIARCIVEARQQVAIKTTKQLAEIIANAVPFREKFKHPATRSFQAIRIQVNHELGALKKTLEQSLRVLCIGGRMVVISFHSLEDRIVKTFMRQASKGDVFPRGLPIQTSALNKRLQLVGKAVKAGDDEVRHNVRSRSAILRIAEKIA